MKASKTVIAAEVITLRAENERLATACRELERKLNEAGAKVSELAVKLGEARSVIGCS